MGTDESRIRCWKVLVSGWMKTPWQVVLSKKTLHGMWRMKAADLSRFRREKVFSAPGRMLIGSKPCLAARAAAATEIYSLAAKKYSPPKTRFRSDLVPRRQLPGQPERFTCLSLKLNWELFWQHTINSNLTSWQKQQIENVWKQNEEIGRKNFTSSHWYRISYQTRKNNSEHHKRGKDMKKYDIKYSFILLVWLRF